MKALKKFLVSRRAHKKACKDALIHVEVELEAMLAQAIAEAELEEHHPIILFALHKQLAMSNGALSQELKADQYLAKARNLIGKE